ncbi:MAG: IS110 family transposase [Candidatus Eremiobacteraeota bacterium]|nr:IS110 family transposase [Candidatus Eremiobacteraeota bacterium]
MKTLYLAFELGWDGWKLAFATEAADNIRTRTVTGRDTNAVLQEVVNAKKKFSLTANAPVVCCYEAGRDGHWLYRFLIAQGMTCHEVDSSSIEVNRRQRRAKTDRLDAEKLLSMLIRFANGEKRVWRTVRVPSEADEARRHLHRELEDWLSQRTEYSNRIKGLLATIGLGADVNKDFPKQLQELRCWNGKPVPEELQARLLRQFEGWQFADRQVKDLENQRARTIRTGTEPCLDKVRRLLTFKGLGPGSTWLFVMEVFAWREIRNAREMGGIAGLTPTPYTSSTSSREQGISKAGNRRLRAMAVEIAWSWVHHQPHSALTEWFVKRFGTGQRLRKIGIVAVARKLLVLLWRFLKDGTVPPGAVREDWKGKMTGRRRPLEAATAA